MSARTWSMYALDTGIFTGVRFACRDESLLATNIPAGCGAREGHFQAGRQRFDAATGQVVACLPGPPAADEWRTWSWDEPAGRWVEVPTPLALARSARTERDKPLAACDWVGLRAADTGEPVPAAWLDYRQALRAVPEQPGFPVDIQWPEPPTS